MSDHDPLCLMDRSYEYEQGVPVRMYPPIPEEGT